MFNTGLKVHKVLLIALLSKMRKMGRKKTTIVSDWSGQIALPWPTATQLSLHVLSGEFKPLEIIYCHEIEGDRQSEARRTGGHPSIIAPTEAQWLSP